MKKDSGGSDHTDNTGFEDQFACFQFTNTNKFKC
jgi:hypothetical protein